VKISLLHPSLGRPEQAWQTFQTWISTSRDSFDIEYILSLNSTDGTRDRYRTLFETFSHATILSSNSTNMVAASNVAAEHSTGDILVLMSDDMFPPWMWDVSLKAEMESKEATVLQVHDGIRNDIMTLPIMNRAAYLKLGYIYHPKYLSMYADNDLAETAKAHGMYKVSELQFEHKHYSVGKAPVDETYRKENEYRKRQGFPI
jgi:hypothetical protein